MFDRRWVGNQHAAAKRGGRRFHWVLLCALGLFALAAAFLPAPAARADGAPTLALDPPGAAAAPSTHP